ncbi:DUF6883 domain-containing protein [Brasilonema bromeliae]|uniref:DUF6883 domain-containing protein n=1 Tax=Brasilonema bromeliae SPC951 TaxID=385972 RepID=A0ABX1P4H1_9CYAN|nr:DUF6883 domain-containing protein [Brasilonema bromeliae]NMG19227.1 hypothetical protein [Brasilonema bromeliae SPC951]
MKLPHPEQAVIDRQKLSGYCLNPEHPEGRHKARLFKSVLGIALDDEEELEIALRQAIKNYDVIPTKRNQYGQKYVVDFMMVRGEQRAVVRSAWIVRDTENFPRLISCYILLDKG